MFSPCFSIQAGAASTHVKEGFVCVEKIKHMKKQGVRREGSDRGTSLRERPPDAMGTWSLKTHRGCPSLQHDAVAEQLRAAGAGPSQGGQLISHPQAVVLSTLGQGESEETCTQHLSSVDSSALQTCSPHDCPSQPRVPPPFPLLGSNLRAFLFYQKRKKYILFGYAGS